MPIEINKLSHTNPVPIAAMSEAKTLLSKISTPQEKLAALLKDKGMPSPLIPRLVNQWDRHHRFTEKDPLYIIVWFFCLWYTTKEGSVFWHNVFKNTSWLEEQKAGSINNASLK